MVSRTDTLDRVRRTSWRRATSSARIRSTSSGWRGTSSAPSTAGRARCRSRRWRRSTSPAGTSIGQSLGVPVWKLLGGTFRDRVPAYANGWYQAERDPADHRPARPAASSVAAIARSSSIRSARRSAELSPPRSAARVAIVAAVREAVGPDVQIMIEMHGRFTPVDGAARRGAARAVRPEWIEEPIAAGERRGDRAGSGRRRSCRSPPASARTRWKTSGPSSSRGSSTSSRSI